MPVGEKERATSGVWRPPMGAAVTFRVRARLPAKVARAALPPFAVGIRSRGGRRWGNCPDRCRSHSFFLDLPGAPTAPQT
jgi:hypothetical protein